MVACNWSYSHKNTYKLCKRYIYDSRYFQPRKWSTLLDIPQFYTNFVCKAWMLKSSHYQMVKLHSKVNFTERKYIYSIMNPSNEWLFKIQTNGCSVSDRRTRNFCILILEIYDPSYKISFIYPLADIRYGTW